MRHIVHVIPQSSVTSTKASESGKESGDVIRGSLLVAFWEGHQNVPVLYIRVVKQEVCTFDTMRTQTFVRAKTRNASSHSVKPVLIQGQGTDHCLV